MLPSEIWVWGRGVPLVFIGTFHTVGIRKSEVVDGHTMQCPGCVLAIISSGHSGPAQARSSQKSGASASLLVLVLGRASTATHAEVHMGRIHRGMEGLVPLKGLGRMEWNVALSLHGPTGHGALFVAENSRALQRLPESLLSIQNYMASGDLEGITDSSPTARA